MAFVIFAIVPNIALVLGGLLFVAPLRRWKLLRAIGAFAFTTAGVLIGFWCFTWVVAHTSLRIAIAMVLLPAWLSFANDKERLQRAIAGVSGVATQLSLRGEEALYDQQSDIQTEYGHMCGDILGYAVGVFVFVRSSPWFW